MDLALYSPEEGYYSSRLNLIGARGDFYTAPHLTGHFGQLISLQLADFWRLLGEPLNFQLVEMGAGQGLLASDVLAQLYRTEPELWKSLTYTIFEKSEVLKEAQRRRFLALTQGRELLENVSWRDLEAFPSESVEGVFFSNELVDAFPFHLIELKQGDWQEVYITLNQAGDFVEETGPLSTQALQNYFDLVNLGPASYEEGYRTEINLAALDWLEKIAQVLKRGYILTIDYGYQAGSRFHPRRKAGTLQTYRNHTVGTNPYLNLGMQDI